MTVRSTWPDERVRADLSALNERAPLTHCITNVVAAGFSANVLLALGASPAMVENAEEAGEFAGLADAMLANLGTLSLEREKALRQAATAAVRAGKPWVLDPVAFGVLAHRDSLAAELLDERPAIVRGNASEVLGLAGEGGGGKGVESTADSADAVEAARGLARRRSCVVAVSGSTDYVTDGEQLVEIPGGDPLLSRVTGAGCALGSVMAALLAVTGPLRAAVAGSVIFAEAGRAASENVPGPGAFATALVDQLYRLNREVATAGRAR